MFLSAIMTLTVTIITFTYHLHARRPLGLTITIASIGTFIGFIPLLNLLPESFLTFCAAVFASQIARLGGGVVGKIASGVAGKQAA